MKLDERTLIPIPRESIKNSNQENHSDNQGRSFEGHHRHYSTSSNLSKSPPRVETGQSDRSSRFTYFTSQSAPTLVAQPDDSYFNRQNPISLEGKPLNEREKKCWDELRETAGNLANFASLVHRTGRIPHRNDIDWARSNFHLFTENIFALQSVLQGESIHFHEAGSSTLKTVNPSRYGKRLSSKSPTLEAGNSKSVPSNFPSPLNRHVSHDKVIASDRLMRPSISLTALTGERCDVPYNKPTPLTYDQRFSHGFEIGTERVDSEHRKWQERSAEPEKAKESRRLDILPESNFSRDRSSSNNGRSLSHSTEKDYSSEMAGPSRSGIPPPLTSPHGNFSRHPNGSPRSAYSGREQSRVLETDNFNHRAPISGQHHINNPVGLPVPQPPSHNPRQSFIGRRASSDYGALSYPTTYSPPYHNQIDERYSFRPPSDHYSAQHGSRIPSGYYRDEHREGNHHDHSYVSGDESGSGSIGFRASKYRKRSRAPAPGSCVSCGVRDTPEWRRGPNGARTLCNACGLHFSKLLKRKKQELGNDSVTVSVEELRSSLKLPSNGSIGQMSPPSF